MNKALWYWIGGVVLLGVGLFALSRMGGSSGTVDLTAGTHVRGGATATVTLVEFADFQCPACAAYHPVLEKLHETFGDRLKMAFRHYPLIQIHQNALIASQAAEAAGAQGKFWEMHGILFERQNAWSSLDNPTDMFVSYAKELLLDTDQFRADLKNDTLKKVVLDDLLAGERARVNATPSFFLNGTKIENPQSYEAFEALVTAALGQTAPIGMPTSTDAIVEVHQHADFSVMINGKPLDFSASKYQSTEEKVRDPYVHLHDGKGNIIHLHRANVTLGEYFKTLGMTFETRCLKLDSGETYCNDDKNTLKLFVNGSANDKFGAYAIQDLDRILISYGPTNDTAIEAQKNAVTNEACIYSETCPERGKAPTENCVGGLGTGCEVKHD